MRLAALSIVISLLPALGIRVLEPRLAALSLDSRVAASEPQAVAPPTDETRTRPGGEAGGLPWYAWPLRLALGGAAVLVLVFLIFQLIRAGGTTIGDAGFEDRIRSLGAEVGDEAKAPPASSAEAEGDDGLTNQRSEIGRASRS